MTTDWTVKILDSQVEEELYALPKDMRARFQRIVRLIEEFGLQDISMPSVRHLEGKLWEMRMKGRGGISRALYITASGQQVVVLRVFIKKTQKTPRKEIELALRRAEEIQ